MNMNGVNDYLIKRSFAGVLIFFLISRLPLLDWGMPAFYISTEYYLSKQVFTMLGSKSLIPPETIYPTGYHIFIGFIYGLIFLFSLLFGLVKNPAQFAAQFLIDPTRVMVIVRLTTVLLTILLMFVLRKVYLLLLAEKYWQSSARSRLSFILPEWVLVLLPGLMVYTFTQLPEIMMILLVSTAFYWHLRYTLTKSEKHLIYAAFLGGLVVSVKYTAGFVVLPILISLIFKNKQGKNFKLFLKAVFFILFGFFVGTPGWVIAPERFLNGVVALLNQSFSMANPDSAGPMLGIWVDILTQNGLAGFIIIFAFIYSLIFFKKDYFMRDWIYFMVFPTFLVISLFSKSSQDYIFPAFPVLVLAFSLITTDWMTKKRIPSVSPAMIILLLFLNWILLSVKYYHKDTRVEVWNWLVKNDCIGQTIIYDHYHIDLPAFDTERYLKRGQSAHRLPEEAKEYIRRHLPKNREMKIIPLMVMDSLQIDGKFKDPFRKQLFSTRAMSFAEMKEAGAKFIILNGEELNVFWNDSDTKKQESSEELRHLQEEREKIYPTLFRKQPVFKVQTSFWKTGPTMLIFSLEDIP